MPWFAGSVPARSKGALFLSNKLNLLCVSVLQGVVAALANVAHPVAGRTLATRFQSRPKPAAKAGQPLRPDSQLSDAHPKIGRLFFWFLHCRKK